MTTASGFPLLACRGIGKRFGGEVALADVDFDVAAGEIHGLVGANGAGKSTLMRILAGALADHDGTIALDGSHVALTSPQTALAHGIAMVYQELSGVGQLSVAENLFLGRQPVTRLGRIDWRRLHALAHDYLRELEIDVDVALRLDRCPLAVRQLVEIARGLHSGCRLLILDEPTSALSPPETRRLFDLMRRLRERGVAIVFISHFLEDVLEACDRVTILRDGRHVVTQRTGELTKHALITSMLGHDAPEEEMALERGVRLPPRSNGPVLLAAEKLSVPGSFENVSLSVAAGETLGLYGFAGAGHLEVVRALAGGLTPRQGHTELEGAPLPLGRPDRAIARGAVLVPADRSQSLVGMAEIYKNVTLAHLHRAAGNWLLRGRELAVARPLLDKVGCRPADPLLTTRALSGGNQQKVVLARWLAGPVRVWLLEEPTRGMDVAAKEEVLGVLAELKRQGAAIVLATSEPELALAHSDRILVMSRGRVRHEFADEHVDKSALLAYA
ncbi:MAG: sugar ABC transporter ATP-binding protein [Pirellulales bacterium]